LIWEEEEMSNGVGRLSGSQKKDDWRARHTSAEAAL
jgi:hypothetical protein